MRAHPNVFALQVYKLFMRLDPNDFSAVASFKKTDKVVKPLKSLLQVKRLFAEREHKVTRLARSHHLELVMKGFHLELTFAFLKLVHY